MIKTYLAIFTTLLLLTSCSSLTEKRAELSVGQIGCSKENIKVIDKGDYNWIAMCKNKKYYCSAGTPPSCKKAQD